MSRAAFIGAQALTYAPALPAVAVAVAALAWKRRDPRAVGVAAVLGAVLAFSAFAYVTGQTFPWLRYTIVVAPLAALGAALVLAQRTPARRGPAAATALAAGLALLGPPVTAWAILHPDLGAGEVSSLRWVVHGVRSTADRDLAGFLPGVRKASRYIDGLGLGDGSVLVDNQARCVPWLILNSERPHQYVIPNDRDFERTLADPQTFGAGWILVPKPEGIDVINRSYPGLYRDGASLATLHHEFKGPGCRDYRLYRIIRSVTALPGQGPPARGRG